ncbi:unnamed protein product [Hyaloperonospora brassicae]|uniref:Trehalase n=1 Tax=Hyaloperonospora brassicae TaxID=162125 RepID=A0AAV0UCF1_HYABA|nr:unnamed protein product [Hyaloperonospora brassicae]
MLWSIVSGLALGRRYRRPTTADPTAASKLMAAAGTYSRFVDKSRKHEIQQLERIYCRGELLHEVQMQELFFDSKTFVDMPIKSSSSADQVLAEFHDLKLQYGQEPLLPEEHAEGNRSDWKTRLAGFIDRHFDPPGAELAPIVPPDYQEGAMPLEIAKIRNDSLRGWAMELHKLWTVLARVPVSVSATPKPQSSFLYALPIAHASNESVNVFARQFNGENVLVVPGGRFRESYYWDTYWIVQGLLISGLHQTARGVVNHLLEYVAEFGFVPNGGRIYYLTRSQPPMLSDMVKLVAKLDSSSNASDEDAGAWDLDYLRAALPLLEREYDFWMRRGAHGHAVEIAGSTANETFVLNRYDASAGVPRPESYREDVSTASASVTDHQNTGDRADVYNEIIAAAESGWDFTSRWCGDYSTLKTARTSRVIPVELNSIMHRFELNLASFHEILGDSVRSAQFAEAAKARVKAMDAVLWSEAEGCWKDYLLDAREHSKAVSASDYSPLWGGAFDVSDSSRLDKIVTSLESSGLLQACGIQTTTFTTGEQWDAPNAWPPLQDIIIEGLQIAGTARAQALANHLVKTWVMASFVAWQNTGLMFEKYDAQQLGGVGDGGEYTPQFGFGWSNGAMLTFLTKYQDQLDNSDGVLCGNGSG